MIKSEVVQNNSGYGKTVKVEGKKFKFEVFVSEHNKRIRLIDYEGPEIDRVLEELDRIGKENEFATKIFSKIKKSHLEVFKKHGYLQEGVIKGYFNGEDAPVMSKFLHPEREYTHPSIDKQETDILDSLKDDSRKAAVPEMPAGYTFIIAQNKKHFQDLAELYKKVFETYPFPIFDPEYLEKTALTHIIYGVIYNREGKAVGAASAETELSYNNAEMTDFATLPSERGKGLATILLNNLEEEARKRGIKYFYTIARSRSLGMNKVFKRAGYEYTGKLINNCNMCGEMENMYIWCKL